MAYSIRMNAVLIVKLVNRLFDSNEGNNSILCWDTFFYSPTGVHTNYMAHPVSYPWCLLSWRYGWSWELAFIWRRSQNCMQLHLFSPTHRHGVVISGALAHTPAKPEPGPTPAPDLELDKPGGIFPFHTCIRQWEAELYHSTNREAYSSMYQEAP